MTKSELIELLAAKQKHLPAKDVELAVKQVLEIMCDALAEGERIEIRGFGSFSLHYRPPRQGRNPKTGDAVALSGVAGAGAAGGAAWAGAAMSFIGGCAVVGGAEGAGAIPSLVEPMGADVSGVVGAGVAGGEEFGPAGFCAGIVPSLPPGGVGAG